MSNTIKGLQAFTNARNTGRAGIALMPGFIKGDLLVPFGWSLAVAPGDSDATIVANLLAAIQTGLTADNPKDRFQFIGKYIHHEDKSEAATMQSFNYGGKKKVNEGKYVQEYLYDNGGVDYHNQVRTYDGKENQYKVLRIDGNGVVYSANQYDETGALIGLQGIELDNLNVYPRKEATFTTEAEFRVGFTFADTKELNDNMFAVATGVNLFTIIEANLVVDIKLIPFTATSARVHPFHITTLSGNVNVADTLGDLLEDITLVSFVNKTTGVAIGVTSVVLNPLTKKYVVTFTAGSGYVSGQIATGRMGSISALAALGAEYFDGSTLVDITMA